MTTASLRLMVGLISAATIAAVLAAAGTAPSAPPTPAVATLAELWQDPVDLETRDLRWGSGGQALAPSPNVDYSFTALDVTGFSSGYDVVAPDGRAWDVKIGVEAQPEVVASRLLWAVGYRQPIVHFVPEWKLKNGPVPTPAGGRFRLESDHTIVGDWPWQGNPFQNTRQLRGLVVANLLINNWDLKTTNNKILMMPAAPGSQRWFTVQDLGASFGKTAWPLGSRNNLADYETQGFVLSAKGGRVQFDYHARHRELLNDITTADVVWLSQLFARLTDRQWADAFQAAAMPDDISARYIRKLKSKVQEGLALRGHGK